MGTEGTIPVQANPAAGIPPVEYRAVSDGKESLGPFGEDGFTFSDFLDIINPLQHIPVVSTLYRQFTGDAIDTGAKVAGATLFGGPIGLASWFVNGLIEDSTGKDFGGHVVSLFDGDGGADATDTEIAEAPAEAAFETAAGNHPAPADALRATPTAPAAPVAPVEAVKTVEAEARREAELFARAQAESERLALEHDRQNAPEASGNSLAPDGGWFAQAMLTALERYNTAAEQPLKGSAGQTVDQVH